LQRALDAAVASLAGTITRVETSQLVAALTFDDGPDPEYTPRLLDVLRRHQAKATFFMLGAHAQQLPELVRQVVAEGHAVANHSWDHRVFPELNSRQRRQQLAACQRALGPRALRMFRPPKGKQTLGSRFDLWLARYTVVGWSVGAEDWLDRTEQWMAHRMQEKLAPGCIICLHDALVDPMWDGGNDRSRTIAAVDLLLTATSSRYRYVTVPELLTCGRVSKKNWLM
jgi:peptidoglycan/xylan/chitin deacetylase (PgdA/CDA1 family)